MNTAVKAIPPVNKRVRAYFAPVNRSTHSPTIFDPAQEGNFSLDAAPAPWVDLGWITKFARKSAAKIEPVRAGSPAVAQSQVWQQIEAQLSFEFLAWGKLQMALAAGSQHMNLLATAAGAANNGSGGVSASAVPVLAGSTASAVVVGGVNIGSFSPGQMVAVDIDYTGQTGFVGSGVSAAYVKSAASVGSDVNFIRRVSFNVTRVSGLNSGALVLTGPLPAGVPMTTMSVVPLLGFVDREGGSFFQEWSALFVAEGQQGDRILYHYPRLQAMQGAGEAQVALSGPLSQTLLAAAFRALPVSDANDGELAVCFRSYLPAAMRQI